MLEVTADESSVSERIGSRDRALVHSSSSNAMVDDKIPNTSSFSRHPYRFPTNAKTAKANGGLLAVCVPCLAQKRIPRGIVVDSDVDENR